MKNAYQVKHNFAKRLACLAMSLLMIFTSAPFAFAEDLGTDDGSGLGSVGSSNAATFSRLELNFNKDWKFTLSDAEGAQMKAYDDSSWDSVVIPHDYSITQNFSTSGTETESGNLPGGTGWYRKMFVLPSAYDGKSFVLNFDGVYQHAYVYVNGVMVGENHYGYNAFSFDITDNLVADGATWNLIAVRVVHTLPSSRWYSGSGIFRDVTMTINNEVRIGQHGPQVTTPDIASGTGTVDATVTVENNSAEEKTLSVQTDILDAAGTRVADGFGSVTIAAGASADVAISTTVPTPTLWSTDNPYLYTYHTTVYDDMGVVYDEYDTDFGFRWMSWDASTGFSLNGVAMKLKGVCMHHDQGALGSIQTYDALYRQVSILKDMGCNAIRTSHNTTSRLLIEICNELGMMLQEEFFDGLTYPKNGNSHDFSEYFNTVIPATNNIMGATDGETWAEFVLKETVKRDRNDPSIIMWSFGNELAEGTSVAYTAFVDTVAEMRTWLDSVDTTRTVTEGNNKGSMQTVDNYVDVLGGNYHINEWSGPYSIPFVATETASAINSRGVYSVLSGSNGLNDLTSYDNNSVGWGTTAARAWYYTIVNDWWAGEFVWTGFDYIGEPTPYNATGQNGSLTPVSSYFGIIDTAGFGKDSYYLYRSMWNEDSTTLHLLPGTWNSSSLALSNGYASVAVYSNAKSIELLLNGNVIGTATSDINTTAAGFTYRTWTETAVDTSVCNTNQFINTDGSSFYSQFRVRHTDGTLSVRAYDDNGNLISDTVGIDSVTTGTATKIASSVWGDGLNMVSDSESFSYIELEAQDAQGNFMNDYNGTVTVSLSSTAGIIAGVDNGDSNTTAKFQQSSVIHNGGTSATIQMYNGRALAIVRSTEDFGTIEVTATANDGLPVDGLVLTSAAETGDELRDEFEEYIPQPSGSYEPTAQERYDGVKAAIDGMDPVSAEGTYSLYTPVIPTGAAIATFSHAVQSAYGDLSVLVDGETPNSTAAGAAIVWSNVNQAAGQYYQVIAAVPKLMDSVTISAPAHRASGTDAVVQISSDGATWTDVGVYSHTETDAINNAISDTYTFDAQVVSHIRVTITTPRASRYWILSEIAASYNGTALDLNSTDINYVPTGDYIITGTASPNYSQGVMTHETVVPTNTTYVGLVTDGTTGTPAVGSDSWTLLRLDNGKYNVYYFENGTRYYLNIATSGTTSYTTVSHTEQEFDVALNSDGTITIGINTGASVDTDRKFINYSGNSNFSQRAIIWQEGTNLTLYKDNGTVVTPWTTAIELVGPVADGVYIIYNVGGAVALSPTASSTAGRLENSAATVTGNTLETDAANEMTFTFVSAENGVYSYYIQNASGQYMNLGTANGTLSFTDTAQTLAVSMADNGRIRISSGSQSVDFYAGSGRVFSTWATDNSATSANQTQALYVKNSQVEVVSEQREILYNALHSGVTYAPGSYSDTTYSALLTALEQGYAVYNNSAATAEELLAAADAIQAAVDALKLNDVVKFDGTIYKYGYNPDENNNRNKYYYSGNEFNLQSLAIMEEAIKTNADLMSQIKTVIDYDGASTTWGEGYADTALNTAVTEYAKLYTLLFNGASTHASPRDTATVYYRTAWNHWTKNNTSDATTDGSKVDEGASVQGLYGSVLGADGLPVSHDAYSLENGLSYYNVATRGTPQNSDVNLTLSVDGSTTKTVALTALNNISVYVPDFFSKNAVLSSDGTYYSKYYWDTGLPFVVTTNAFGINTYAFDSNSSDYLLQASYDDANHTAEANLTEMAADQDWSVQLYNASLTTNKGIFPFNYQAGTTTYTGESAIYHYGLSFNTSFYIPSGGTYDDGEDIVFRFSGDDDVLVYVDNVLVLDNGGLHGARYANINFTECSVTYQYAMDIAGDGTVVNEDTPSVTYTYGDDEANAANEITPDIQTALNYLNEVKTSNETHTFSFFFLERGSTESNCSISFNIQQLSEEVDLNNQTLVADYGLPIAYNVTDNNVVSDAALANDIDIEYVGILASESITTDAITFTEPDNLNLIGASGTTHTRGGFGDFSLAANGDTVYAPDTMNFTSNDSFYVVAKVTDDPTYAKGTSYYAYERVTYVPATTIYYEDNFGSAITYTDGSTAASFDNTLAQLGQWQTKTDGTTPSVYQAADLTDDIRSNVYGYDDAYAADSVYSNGSSHYVTVSPKNNPNATYSGGSGAQWPTAEFGFTGTGFDIISVTDCTTGMINVRVYDANGVQVRNNVVDTFYGFSYGRLYADENGDPTRTDTGVPIYYTATMKCSTDVTYYAVDETITRTVHYLDVSGSGYTETPTYYDADGNLTTEVTENPAYAYAYAYGWLRDGDSSVDSLYQIPVIKVEGLDYGEYSVVITPMYSSLFGHGNESEFNGETVRWYSFYLDAIRVYDPAGVGNSIASTVVSDAYKADGEAYPDVIELKDMLIGSESLKAGEGQGVIFIDGIAASDNDLETYKTVGPNNELYLSGGQAVAFEIWSNAVPVDIQIGAKLAIGTPTFTLSHATTVNSVNVTSATDMYYSINALTGNVSWNMVTGADGNNYYTSGVVVIENTGTADSVLSLTNVKWTYASAGGQGHHSIPSAAAPVNLMLMSSASTARAAYSLRSMRTADLSVDESNITADNSQVTTGENVTLTITTSDDVYSLVITSDGETVVPEAITSLIKEQDGKNVKEWTVTLATGEPGEYIYSIAGVYENGYTDGSEPAEITVTVTAPETDEAPSIWERIVGMFNKLISFFQQLWNLLGVAG